MIQRIFMFRCVEKNRINYTILIVLVSVSLYLSTSFERSSERLNWKSTVRTYHTGNVYQLRIEDVHHCQTLWF